MKFVMATVCCALILLMTGCDGKNSLQSMSDESVQNISTEEGIASSNVSTPNQHLDTETTLSEAIPSGGLKNVKYSTNFSIIQRPSLENFIIPYDRITIVASSDRDITLFAINETLADDYNRTIVVKGYKNGENYYFYNIPLVAGENTVIFKSKTSSGTDIIQTITLRAEANESLPLGLGASDFRGVGSLAVSLETSTLLNAKRFLFDTDGDGIIEKELPAVKEQTDDNITFFSAALDVNYTAEGRYRPMVSVETDDGLFYSTGPFALSLDVVATEDQKDPAGSTPLDIALEFKEAIISNDRAKVERLLGYNSSLIDLIYSDPRALALIQDIYSRADEWKVEVWDEQGRASVSFAFDINGTKYAGGLELMVISPQIYTGRDWIIDFLY